MKMTKKILAALLVACSLLVLVACGNGSTSTDTSVTESSTAVSETVSTEASETVSTEASETVSTEASETVSTEVSETVSTEVSETVSEESVAPIEYTKGAIENGVYTNEWANIKFQFDSTTWKEGAAADYLSFESATTDCGLIAGIATEGRQLAIVFENNPGNSMSAETYIDNIKKGMTAVVNGYTFSEQYKKTIAGKEYIGLDAELTQSGVTVYQTFLATQHDGKFISFIVTSLVGADEINPALDKVTTVK